MRAAALLPRVKASRFVRHVFTATSFHSPRLKEVTLSVPICHTNVAACQNSGSSAKSTETSERFLDCLTIADNDLDCHFMASC